MVDCLSYVSSGSTVSKPEGTCCSGLKTIEESKCLYEAFKNSAPFGVSLNVTKALALPSACKISAPSVSNRGGGKVDEVNDSSIEQVRLTVPITDDPTLPCLTFRT